MSPEILLETTVGKHNPPCHLQMPTKALSCKKEAICDHGLEDPSCPVGQGSFKMDCFKVEKCSVVRRVQIWHSCWKSRTPCPPGKRRGRPSSVLSAFSSKASISDGMGCISAYGMGSFRVLELQKLITLMPRCLQTVLKRRGDATPGIDNFGPGGPVSCRV